MDTLSIAVSNAVSIFNTIYLALSQCYIFGSSLWQLLFWGAIFSAVFAVIVGRLRF